MNSPAVDIVDILEAESSLGLILGTNIFIGREPITPINCVTVFDTGGRSQANLTDQGYEYPDIAIRVRNTSYVDGWNIIENIKKTLHGIGNETWNGAYYASILCDYGPGLLDWDENSRARFYINFNIQRRT